MGCGKSKNQGKEADPKNAKKEKDGKVDPKRKRGSTTGVEGVADGGTLLNDSAMEELLRVLPGPLESKVSASSLQSPIGKQTAYDDKQVHLVGSFGQRRIGYVCKKGLKPVSPNQDAFAIVLFEGHGVYSVFDGHGPFGHDVSDFVHTRLPSKLAKDPSFRDDPQKALAAAFSGAHDDCLAEAEKTRQFSCELSGTSATVVVHRGHQLFTAHVGDSRAVLATGDTEAGPFRALDLAADHRPDLPQERARIEAKGGKVLKLEDDIPYRVFVGDSYVPGLAMSRSIGDTKGAEAGIIHEPEVSVRGVESIFRFFLVCSDGVWELIKSQEAVDMVGKYGPDQVQAACEELAREAWTRWIREEIDVVDDITVICSWFPAPPPRADGQG